MPLPDSCCSFAKWPMERPFSTTRDHICSFFEAKPFSLFLQKRQYVLYILVRLKCATRDDSSLSERRNEIEVFLRYVEFFFVCFAKRYSAGCNVGEIQLVLHCWTGQPRILCHWHFLSHGIGEIHPTGLGLDCVLGQVANGIYFSCCCLS